MNPSTGTFITMDEYAGSIFEPVSLHKYLYVAANPISYCDPSGYMFTLTEEQTVAACMLILAGTALAGYTVYLNSIGFFNGTLTVGTTFTSSEILEYDAGLLTGQETSSTIGITLAESTIADTIPTEIEGNPSSSGSTGSPKKPKKPKKKDYKHLDLKEILRRFKLTPEQWH